MFVMVNGRFFGICDFMLLKVVEYCISIWFSLIVVCKRKVIFVV